MEPGPTVRFSRCCPMRCAFNFPPLLALTMLSVARLGAQPVADSAGPTPEAAAPVVSTPAVAPPPPHAASPAVAAKLAALAPKFVPPPPAAASSDNALPEDLRETDKPKNGIVRLPNYVVREAKPRIFKAREMLTPAGQLALTLERHPGLRLDPFYWLGLGTGGALYAEEVRLERLKEMTDQVSLLSYSEQPLTKEVKVMILQVYKRSNEWVDTGGPHQR
jgi:hypothetical protein